MTDKKYVPIPRFNLEALSRNPENIARVVDDLGREHESAVAVRDEAAEEIAALKAEVLPLVQQLGSARGKKSRAVEGVEFEIVATDSQTVTVNEAAVQKLEKVLREKGQARLFKKLIRIERKFVITKEAADLVAAPPVGAPKNLAALFNACRDVDGKDAKVTIARRKPEPAAKKASV